MKPKKVTLIMLGEKTIATVNNATPADIHRGIKSSCMRRPGDGFYVDYDFTAADDAITVVPKNIFTALRLLGYDVPTELEHPFKLWKRFIIMYHPKVTGFFLA
jgi:hypothetical protein